ncbi:hypothetical protein J717_1283 [Acinetobacter baumannii 121738]|nr:hypothetical protein J717_1283 [Acinetobacter baumannii 121738]
MLFNINGCASHPRQSVDLQEYLKNFIGKSSTTIQQDLNLRSLGFQVARTPQKTSDQLIYTILRPLSIPIPMVSNVDIRGGSVPIQSGNLSGNSYDINFNCKVIFKLKMTLPSLFNTKVKLAKHNHKKRSFKLRFLAK